MQKKRRVYLDYASATPVLPAVQRAVSKALIALPGNPSALHEEGRMAKEAVNGARARIARSLRTRPEEIVFTSGGTESNNIALRGVIGALASRGVSAREQHIVSSTIEHASVLETLLLLEKEGVSVTYVEPQQDGIVSPEDVFSALTEKTVLITLAHVNSEIGTIQPVRSIGSRLARAKRTVSKKLLDVAPEMKFPVFHVDAAQSPLYLDAGPHTLFADLVTYDAQKLLGPKGVGILYRNFSVPLEAVSGGGSQERGIRPGTENTSGIVGASVAFEYAAKGRDSRSRKIGTLRDTLIADVLKAVPNATLTGSKKNRIANNAHFVIPGVDGDYLTVLMDTEGIAVSPRSACAGTGGSYSHVVFALTKDTALAKNTIRFSLGPATTKRDVHDAVRALMSALRTVH